MKENIKRIGIELKDADYCPINIEYEDGSSSYQGGGDINCAIVGVIANAVNDKYMKNKWDRLNEKDRNHIAKHIQSAFDRCKEDVQYYLANFYDSSTSK